MKNLKLPRPIALGRTPNGRAGMIKKAVISGALLFCLCCFSERLQATQIDWAGTSSPNGANAVGAPNGVNVGGAAGTSTFGGFGSGAGTVSNYSTASLATLLGVSQATLNQANFIAFDANGTAGATFESSAWTFSDGSNTTTVNHTFGNTAAQDGAGVLALGNITLPNYMSFFGTATTPPDGDYAYILFDISSSVNTSSGTFAVSMVSPGDGSGPGTPDMDALGTMAVPEPDTSALAGVGLLLFSLGSYCLRRFRRATGSLTLRQR